jgi:putative aminopeptidase FrvX
MSKPSPTNPVFGDDQFALLERLSNAIAVSGNEVEVREIVLEQVKPFADEIKVDSLGNVIARHSGDSAECLRVLLTAHMDEVGFMLVDESEGFFRFELIGGIDLRQLPGKLVQVGPDHIPGIIGVPPIHLAIADERQSTPSLESLRIDLGPNGSKKAHPGETGTFAPSFRKVGQSIRGKALDDRLGVVILIELIKHAPANIDMYAAFTVQEEIGGRGARVAAYQANPDLAIIIDSTPAYDLPTWDGSENRRYNSRLDYGPAIYVADGSTISNPRLVRHMIETGEALGIPYQLRQPGGGGTDAGAVHRQRAGIPSVSVSTPGRYAHSAAGLARIADWQNTFSLVQAALLRLSRDVLSAS